MTFFETYIKLTDTTHMHISKTHSCTSNTCQQRFHHRIWALVVMLLCLLPMQARVYTWNIDATHILNNSTKIKGKIGTGTYNSTTNNETIPWSYQWERSNNSNKDGIVQEGDYVKLGDYGDKNYYDLTVSSTFFSGKKITRVAIDCYATSQYQLIVSFGQTTSL